LRLNSMAALNREAVMESPLPPYQIVWLSTLVLVAFAILASFVLLPAESRYLRSSKDRATEADVRLHLGQPSDITLDENKNLRWTYETKTAVQEGTNNAWTMVDSHRCETYHLTFDDQHILRDWTSTSLTC